MGVAKQPGGLYVISAPSGAGKTTLIARMIQHIPRLALSISYTTRSPRANEGHGREYFFVDQTKFDLMIRNQDFLEHAKVHGNSYGTSAQHVKELQKNGTDVILDIDVQGAQQVKRHTISAFYIFILPPSLQSLRARLLARGTENQEAIQLRLTNAKSEIAAALHYDYVLVNENLDDSFAELKQLLLDRRAGKPLQFKISSLKECTIFKELGIANF